MSNMALEPTGTRDCGLLTVFSVLTHTPHTHTHTHIQDFLEKSMKEQKVNIETGRSNSKG